LIRPKGIPVNRLQPPTFAPKFPPKAEPTQAAELLTGELPHLLGLRLVAYPFGEMSAFGPFYGHIAAFVTLRVVLQPREHILSRRCESVPIEANSFQPALSIRSDALVLLGYSLIANPVSQT